jgi:hypothetical protein
MEVSGQLLARASLPPGKSSWYQLDRKLSGLKCPSGRSGEEKNSQLLPGLELPIIQPFAQRYTTELYQYHTLFDWLMLEVDFF